MSNRKRACEGRLDDILGKTAKLHKTVRAAWLTNQHEHEVDWPMMLPPTPTPASPEPPSAVCRNPKCDHTEFDLDHRAGAKVCMHCGTVQNNRPLESLEEEHRSFAGDEHRDARRRTEQNDGKTGGRVGDPSLSAASALANASQDKEEERRVLSNTKIEELAHLLAIPQAVQDTAANLCTTLAESHRAHDELCRDRACPLRSTGRHAKKALVAAAVLKVALQRNNMDRQFQEFAAAIPDTDVFRTHVADAFNLANDHLAAFGNGRAYPCVASGATVCCSASDQGAPVATQVTSLLPRLCQQIQMPYRVEDLARHTHEAWSNGRGTKAALPQTMAAAAILSAATELRGWLASADLTFELSLVSRASGIQESTIRKTLKAQAAICGGAASSSAP